MSKSKQKGTYFENMVVDKLTAGGIKCERVPLSGSLMGKYSDDVVIGSIDAPEARLECKFRQSISIQLWDWLEGVQYLAIKRNHKAPLVMMTMDEFIKLYKQAHPSA